MSPTSEGWTYGPDQLFTEEHEATVRETIPGYKAEFPIYLVRDEKGGFVADCGCHELSEERACLIAAAPDLLEACEQAKALLDALRMDPGMKPLLAYIHMVNVTDDGLIAAIAKARDT